MTTLETLPSGAVAGDLAELMAANRAAARAAITRIAQPTRGALYTRSSEDNEQTGVTTGNQEVEGRALADARDVPIVGVYSDIDRSAYHRHVVRADFERLLRDARAGLFDVVIVRHTDRLYRRLTDLSRIVDELTPYAVVWAVYEGEVDLTSAGGIFKAQILGAVAEHESRLKGERIKSQNLIRSERGRMNTSMRPFGWAWREPCDGVPREAGGDCEHNPKRPHAPGERPILRTRGGVVPHPVEGPALVEAYRRAADGRSVRSIAAWLAAEGFAGPRGGALPPDQVGRLLQNPRNAGLVALKGSLLAEEADGQKLVDVELWQRVRGIFEDPARRTTPGRPAGTLLSGIARCGECGGPMNSTNTRTVHADGTVVKHPAYVCRTAHHVRRRRALIDAPVVARVAVILAEQAGALRSYASPVVEEDDPAAAEVERLETQIEDWQAASRSGNLNPADFTAIVNPLRARLTELRERAARSAGRPALAALLAAPDPVASWEAMVAAEDPEPARVVLRELLDRVVVLAPAVRRLPTTRDLRIEGGWFES